MKDLKKWEDELIANSVSDEEDDVTGSTVEKVSTPPDELPTLKTRADDIEVEGAPSASFITSSSAIVDEDGDEDEYE